MIAASLLVEEAVAEEDAQLVVACCHLSGHVVDIEEYGLVIVAPMGGELGFPHLLTVDGGFVESETADAQFGMLDGSQRFERTAQDDALP